MKILMLQHLRGLYINNVTDIGVDGMEYYFSSPFGQKREQYEFSCGWHDACFDEWRIREMFFDREQQAVQNNTAAYNATPGKKGRFFGFTYNKSKPNALEKKAAYSEYIEFLRQIKYKYAFSSDGSNFIGELLINILTCFLP